MQAIDDEMALISCSYGPDLQRCQRLCQSVDRWVSGDITHQLIVPARDIKRFRALENSRRAVAAVEDVVPALFWQLPLTRRWWLGEGVWPVRGWIMQQITKLCANFVSRAEYLVFADSDLQFIAPLSRDTLIRDGLLRLHRLPGAKNSGRHLLWHHRAAALLNLPRQYFGADYIGQLISWRRSHLEGLQAHLERSQQRPWYRGIARAVQFSEYILYGAYIERVVGLCASGHFGCTDDLCHCCWFIEDARALASGRAALRKNALAVLLQSNLGLSDDEERRILRRCAPQNSALAEHSR